MTRKKDPEPGKDILSKHGYYFVFAALALLLVKDFLQPGYIFALDMVFAPGAFRSFDAIYGLSNVYSVLPLMLILDFLNIFFSVEIIQKSLFFLVFFVSGVSSYRMCPEEWGAGRYFAGFLYMLNPFIYVRFLAGHWLILLAYAVVPFVIKGFMDFFRAPSMKRSVNVAFLLTFVFMLETHTPFLLFLVFGVFLIVRMVDSKKNGSSGHVMPKYIILIGVFLVILNSYWLIPGFTGNQVPLGDITTSDLYTFTTSHEAGFSTLFTTASMYGFWRGGYIYTKDLLPYWYIFFIIILFFSVHGFVSNYRNPQHGAYVRAFGIIAALSVLLAAGIAGPFGGIFEFLFNNVFFFKGFREPQKFVGLLVLSYAYLGGLGISELEKAARAKSKGGDKKTGAWLVIALALLTPFIYSFTMFNGFWGQLKPGDYPLDWYEVNNFLNEDKQDFKVLFLPWHLYMDFKWLPSPQKRIANPADIFFGKPVIRGDNMEAGPIYSSSSSPVSRYLELQLGKGDTIENFGELLVPLNVKYILLAKEANYKKYDFLYNQGDLEVVKDTENLVVFRNRNPVSRFYQADNITSGYEKGNHVPEWQLLNYTVESPVKYTIGQPAKRYVIFSERYTDDWKLDGRAPLSNFGVTNVYDTSGLKGNILYNHRFNIYITGYVISVIGFIFLIYFYFKKFEK